MLSQQSSVKCPHCGMSTTVGDIGNHLAEVHIGTGGVDWLCSNGCPYRTGSVEAIAVHCLLTGHPASLIQRQRMDLAFADLLSLVQSQLASLSCTKSSRDYPEPVKYDEPVYRPQSCDLSPKAFHDQSLMATFGPEHHRSPPKSAQFENYYWEEKRQSNTDENRYSPPSYTEEAMEQADTRPTMPSESVTKYPVSAPKLKTPKPSLRQSTVECGQSRSKFFCGDCSVRVSSTGLRNLIDHLFGPGHQSRTRTPLDLMPWQCRLCKVNFSTYSTSRRHFKREHGARDASLETHEKMKFRVGNEYMYSMLSDAFADIPHHKIQEGLLKMADLQL